MNIKNKNTLEYRTGIDFKVLHNLSTLIREAKELKSTDLEVSMLEYFLNGFDEYMDYRRIEERAGGKEIYFEKVNTLAKIKISIFLKSQTS
ncbi:MAG: hypothetical protein DRQ78_03930 [Epsilonproteobacteria bacterium]|nr:MAG: hypothetical protein DRQ78_03930 [Campylobacterota bacterium]